MEQATVETTTSEAAKLARPWWRWLDAGEFVVALLLLAAAVYLRVEFARHAGPLWRDEVAGANVATLPTLGDVFGHLEFSSAPIVWVLIERYWILAGPGRTDAGLRALGLIIALVLLPALWWTGKQIGLRPVVSLLLLGLAPAVITSGGVSNRPYGLSVLLLVVLYGFTWRVATTEQPRRRDWMAAIVVALLAVHTLYHNAVAVLALCAAASAVALRRGCWRDVARVALVGLVAAMSLLVYLPVVRRTGEWSIVVQAPITLSWIVDRSIGALGPHDVLLAWVWAGACVAAAACALAGRDRIALFATVALVVGIIAHAMFLLALKFVTESWYYVTLMALAALSIDAMIASATRPWRVRLVPAVIAGVVAMYAFPGVHRAIKTRQTNIDHLAAHVAHHASEEDYVVVYPWYNGISFDRYYAGRAPWTTVPAIGDYRFHRYDTAKQLMQDPQATRPVRERIERTLKSGGRVWFVGRPFSTSGGREPEPMPPAPLPVTGWNVAPHTAAWGTEAMHVLMAHAATFDDVTPPNPERISPYEDPPLFVAEGWR